MSERKNNKIGFSLLSYSLLHKITTYVIGEISEVSRLVNNRQHIAKNRTKYKRCRVEYIYILSQVSKQFRDMFHEKNICFKTCRKYMMLWRYQKYFIDLSEVLLRTGIIVDLDSVELKYQNSGTDNFSLSNRENNTVTIKNIYQDNMLILDTEYIWNTQIFSISKMQERHHILYLRIMFAIKSKKRCYNWEIIYTKGSPYESFLVKIPILTIGEALYFIRKIIEPHKENLNSYLGRTSP